MLCHAVVLSPCYTRTVGLGVKHQFIYSLLWYCFVDDLVGYIFLFFVFVYCDCVSPLLFLVAEGRFRPRGGADRQAKTPADGGSGC